MATGGNTKVTTDKSKKRKQRYLPQNKPVKKRGAYPLRPGIQGFFLTCDGGREHQAAHEALNIIDSLFDELVDENDSGMTAKKLPGEPLNKKITFSYSSDEDSNADGENEGWKEKEDRHASDIPNHDHGEKMVGEEKEDKHASGMPNHDNSEKSADEKDKELLCEEQKTNKNAKGCEEAGGKIDSQVKDTEQPPLKKPCLETSNTSETVRKNNSEEKSIDELIEAELEELGDRSKRRFLKLDAGCNGLAFIQMRKIAGDPTPTKIVQHIMASAAKTRKHMSRSILRVIPVETACYASEDEVTKAIRPLVEQYFPPETSNPQKFAVIYKARANTGIDRMKMINAVAKSVPSPHRVDLTNPQKTIVVEIVKTICLIGVVEKYKEFAKYNLRELTSSIK